MVLPNFLKSAQTRLAGFLHPGGATASVAAVEGTAVRSEAPAATGGGSSLGFWALIVGAAGAVWYFFIHKRGDKRHKHKY